MSNTAKLKFIKPELLRLKTHPDFNEDWLQKIIAGDPSILGLGELESIHKERRQGKAGRIDFLMRNPNSGKRFEIEVQLGSIDESHIIRAIEYWDIERKRYSQFDHCCVIVAEEITGRFLNVISLFNGHIPLIALQMQAVRIGDAVTLVFSRVLDEVNRGFMDPDTELEEGTATRATWAQKSAPSVMTLLDNIFKIIKEIDPIAMPNYVKPYIGISRNSVSTNYVSFIPQKKALRMHFALPQNEPYDKLFDQSGFEQSDYDSTFKNYRISLRPDDLNEGKDEMLKKLIGTAFQERVG